MLCELTALSSRPTRSRNSRVYGSDIGRVVPVHCVIVVVYTYGSDIGRVVPVHFVNVVVYAYGSDIGRERLAKDE